MTPVRSVSFQRTIPIRHEVDVFVAGGGPAGFAAALVAARQGRRVYVAEGTACFGGMGTSGLVPTFMQFGDGEHFDAGGVGREIYDRLWDMDAAGPRDKRDFGCCRLSIRVEALKRLYDLIAEASGLDFTFHTQLIAVEGTDGCATHAFCFGKSGLFAVRAKLFVDGTGDGDLAAWAGAPFAKGDEEGRMMPGTLCSLWADVDWDTVHKSGLGAGGARLKEAFLDEVFSVEDRHLPGMWCVGEHVGGGNIGHTYDVDGTDERSLTKALVRGRKRMVEYERYYKEYMKGFEKMELVGTGALLGLRETRRILGDYVLSLKDFKSRAVFDDEIGRYCYPVDIHASSPDEEAFDQFEEEFRNLRYEKGESYGIPYRILTPLGLDNVLVAGRCVSSDRYILGSIRVMPGCYITGQAAGMAAAMAVEKNTSTRGIDVKELQERLKELGAFLPNA
ncbi:MAG: FAD-dependent oxidoreductase [Candidatus Latescibacteria bacterium]|nr:FAD-dependent oxidoreductase [Candidatus Latescibacterota bacterium]